VTSIWGINPGHFEFHHIQPYYLEFACLRLGKSELRIFSNKLKLVGFDGDFHPMGSQSVNKNNTQQSRIQVIGVK